MAWAIDAVCPFVSNVPPDAPSVTARVEASAKFAPQRSVPPLSVSAPVEAPRPLSAFTTTAPPASVVAPL